MDQQTSDDPAVYGVNDPLRPHVPTPQEITDYLDFGTVDLVTRREDLMAGVSRFLSTNQTIDNDETAGHGTDLMNACKRLESRAEDKRKAEKEPFLSGGRSVDSYFKTMVLPIQTAMQPLDKRLTAYAQAKYERQQAAAREAARLAQEEAGRAAAKAQAAWEAAQAQAAADRAAQAAANPEAPIAAAVADDAINAALVAEQQARDAADYANARPAEHSRTYGDAGGVSSLRRNWKHRTVDLMALVQAVAAKQVPLDALMVADDWIKLQIKRGTDKGGNCTTVVPGVEIYAESKLGYRA